MNGILQRLFHFHILPYLFHKEKVDLKQLVPSGSRIIALNKVAELANSVLSFSTYSSSDVQQVEAVETELNNFDVSVETYGALTTVEKQDIQKLKEYLTDYLNERKKEQATIKIK